MTTKPTAKELAGLLARLILGGVFIYAGVIKALAPAEEFAYAIESYRLLTPKLALWSAYVFPWIELYAGLLLAAGIFTRFSALFNGAMLLFFEFMLAQAWLRGLPITSCGCFGSGGGNSITREFIQNIGLIVLAWAAFRYGSSMSADRLVGPHDA
ncbi:MAG TPA: DoxX family protein [Elusimicrobia bacterium]|nr:DoxX family protein [Elusimicrobiota bacterium]